MNTRPIGADTRAAVLELNNRHVEQLSYLDLDRLENLVSMAFYARQIGAADAFMISFDQDAKYGSPNFLWLQRKFRRFVYVDRIVVAASARGRGLARVLYGELFAAALEKGHDTICCEVNAEPPNPASDALHAALGFQVVGHQTLAASQKTVRYYARKIGEADAGRGR